MKQATHFAVQKGWKVLLTDIGINLVEVLALAGLPGDLCSREGAKITPGEYFSFWRAVEELAGEDVPLKIGKALTGEAFDPPIFASLCSNNLNEALQRIAQYKRLIGPMTLEVERNKKQTTVTIECYGQLGELPKSIGTLELVFFTALARLGTRKRIVPLRLELATLPKKLSPYDDYFDRRIAKGEATRIVFSAADAKAPFITENKTMWDFFEPGLKEQLSELESGATTSQRLKSALLAMLPSGNCTIEKAAAKLGMSPRTLQRHLAKEGVSFQEVLTSTRKELAKHYLADSAITTGEISFLLGYQDSNSFLRAFKDWTGVTPGQFREPYQEKPVLH